MPTWDPFSRPRPTLECLSSKAVLVQAWKKSHAYIRRHNWYADCLELDRSAAELQASVASWSDVLASRDTDALVPRPCRLVPAPKAGRWGLFAGDAPRWRPEDAMLQDGVLPTRPLAHLDVWSQTLATALMICLADEVEAEQGETLPQQQPAGQIPTSSYGNRLFCRWCDGKPRFGWGNATTYSRYFLDYQAFLSRPRRRALKEAEDEGRENVGVVSLDLSGFYDQIQPAQVVKQLRQLCDRREVESDEGFWTAAEAITSWSWAPQDAAEKSPKLGLPQGAVVSGFLSNVALLDLDAGVREQIREGGGAWKLGDWEAVDYVRYVDDLRLVVRRSPQATTLDPGRRSGEVEAAEKEAEAQIVTLLEKVAPTQQLNKRKTAFLGLDELGSKSGDARLMTAITGDMSGPMDRHRLETTSRSLVALLNGIEGCNAAPLETGSLRLAAIQRPRREVRDETVIRFAAYRQNRVLRDRRRLTADPNGTEAAQLDAEARLAAHRLVRHWSLNPSLLSVLRHALELFPSKDLLGPIFEAIEEQLQEADRSAAGPSLVAAFCLAEILRAASTLADPLQRPIEASFRTALQEAAVAALKRKGSPWYVRQQAALCLLNLGEAEKLLSLRAECDDESADYVRVAELVTGGKAAGRADAPLVAVALQLTSPKKRPAAFERMTEKADSSLRDDVLGLLPLPALAPIASRGEDIRGQLGEEVPLIEVITHPSAPLASETAVLQLLVSVIEACGEEEYTVQNFNPRAMRLRCNDWSTLRHPRSETEQRPLTVLLQPSDTVTDNPFEPPEWAEDARQVRWLLGSLARSAFTGQLDPTRGWSLETEPVLRHRGVRSSPFKRRHGMFNRPDGLAGPSAACSGWLSSLFSAWLAWPGMEAAPADAGADTTPDWTTIATTSGLLNPIRERLQALHRCYASASRMPVYIHRMRQRESEATSLKLVLVQTALPKLVDLPALVEAGPAAAAPRAAQRAHLARMLRLAEEHLLAQVELTARPLSESEDRPRPRADLTLLPELSVHTDDLDLVHAFCDRTGSAVFCGVFFRRHRRGHEDVWVNEARWVLRDETTAGRTIREIAQGKHHLTGGENELGVESHRPQQVVIELVRGTHGNVKVTGAVCLDATDAALAADLRDQTDLFAVAALNRDTQTFDALAQSMRFVMYQHVAIANSGEFGGSLVHAPYQAAWNRVLAHEHGGGHPTVAVVDVHLHDYQQQAGAGGNPVPGEASVHERPLKAAPAGYRRHEVPPGS